MASRRPLVSVAGSIYELPTGDSIASGLYTAFTETNQTATANQTVFTVSYTVGLLAVYMNGVKLLSTDFTATNGTSVTLTTGASAGAELTFVAFSLIDSATTATTGSNTFTGAQNWSPTQTIASAATTDIGAATSNSIIVSGTTTITSLGTIAAGAERVVTFSGALTLTHNATSLILPGGLNVTTAAGDVARFISLGSGNWRCVEYSLADAYPVDDFKNEWLTLAYSASITAPVTLTAASIIAIEISGSKELLVLYDTAYVLAAIYDIANNVMGPVTLVRTVTNNGFVRAIEVSSGSVLVVSCSSTTALEAVILSISGTTITVNTAATATLAGTISSTSGGELIACGSTFCIGYQRATTISGIRGMTVSGTTVTIGAEVTVSGTGAIGSMYDIDGTKFVCFSATTTFVYATPVSVSGSTLTVGTEASTAATSTTIYTKLLGSGRLSVFYTNSNTTYGAIVSISGTVATLSVVALSPSVASLVPAYTHVIGSQVIVVSFVSNSLVRVNVLTDSSGTAVAGTSLLLPGGNSCGVVMHKDSTGLSVQNGSTHNLLIRVEISGNEPIIISSRPVMYSLSNYFSGSFSPAIEHKDYGITELIGSRCTFQLGLPFETVGAAAHTKEASYRVLVYGSVWGGQKTAGSRSSASTAWAFALVSGTMIHLRKIKAL